MRRKVLQDFANTVCQRLVDLPEGFDLAAFVHYGSGNYYANVLSGTCTHDRDPIPSLRLCAFYKEWLMQQSMHHGIEFSALTSINVEIAITVSELNTRVSYGHRFASARFDQKYRCEIKTDEKIYVGSNGSEKIWGFDWYYEKLFGRLPESWS